MSDDIPTGAVCLEVITVGVWPTVYLGFANIGWHLADSSLRSLKEFAHPDKTSLGREFGFLMHGRSGCSVPPYREIRARWAGEPEQQNHEDDVRDDPREEQIVHHGVDSALRELGIQALVGVRYLATVHHKEGQEGKRRSCDRFRHGPVGGLVLIGRLRCHRGWFHVCRSFPVWAETTCSRSRCAQVSSSCHWCAVNLIKSSTLTRKVPLICSCLRGSFAKSWASVC